MSSHGHHRSDGPAKGAFWLSIVSLVFVLISGVGVDSGMWSFRIGWFLLQWGAYQGVFGGCFALGVLADDRRKTTLRWALPGAVAGLAAAGSAYFHLGFPGA